MMKKIYLPVVLSISLCLAAPHGYCMNKNIVRKAGATLGIVLGLTLQAMMSYSVFHQMFIWPYALRARDMGGKISSDSTGVNECSEDGTSTTKKCMPKVVYQHMGGQMFFLTLSNIVAISAIAMSSFQLGTAILYRDPSAASQRAYAASIAELTGYSRGLANHASMMSWISLTETVLLLIVNCFQWGLLTRGAYDNGWQDAWPDLVYLLEGNKAHAERALVAASLVTAGYWVQSWLIPAATVFNPFGVVPLGLGALVLGCLRVLRLAMVHPENCAICWNGLDERSERRFACDHTQFHPACILQWIGVPEHPTCPLCRAALLPRDV